MMKEFEIQVDTSIDEVIELQRYIQLANLRGIRVSLKKQPDKEKFSMGNDIINTLVFMIAARVTDIMLKELFDTIKDFFESRYKSKSNKPRMIIKTIDNDKKYDIEEDQELKNFIDNLGE